MPTPIECPRCKADLRGDPIPEKFRALFGKGAEYYSHVLITRDENGRRLFYECPICWHAWNPKGK